MARIWYQRFVHPVEQAAYIGRLQQLLDAVARSGVPFENGIVVAAKAAEMALELRRLTGTVVSRRGTYAKATPETVEEYLGARW